MFSEPIFYSDTKLPDRFIFKNKRFIFKNQTASAIYNGCPVLKIIDLNTLDKQDPDFVWKVFEQTLKELDIAEDF